MLLDFRADLYRWFSPDVTVAMLVHSTIADEVFGNLSV